MSTDFTFKPKKTVTCKCGDLFHLRGDDVEIMSQHKGKRSKIQQIQNVGYSTFRCDTCGEEKIIGKQGNWIKIQPEPEGIVA